MATTFVYDDTDFLNDSANLERLRSEIAGAEIGPACTGLRHEEIAAEVTADFATDLSGGEVTTLDGLVAAHDGTPLGGEAQITGPTDPSGTPWAIGIDTDGVLYTED